MDTVANVGFKKTFSAYFKSKIYYGAREIAQWVKPLAKKV